jgi:hypothetical protein
MTPEQIAALQARAAQLEAENTQFKKDNELLTGEVTQFKKESEVAESSRRESELRTVFSNAGRELTAEKLALYQSMPAAAFSAVVNDLKDSSKAKPGQKLPTSLFSHTKPPAENTPDDNQSKDSGLVAMAAKRFAK